MLSTHPPKQKSSPSPSSSSAAVDQASTPTVDVARSVLDHCAIRYASVQREILEAQERGRKPGETLLKARDMRVRQVLAACLKLDEAERQHGKSIRR